jgi:hypothetical protein
MPAPIYPNCRRPDRDQLVDAAHARLNVKDLAQEFELSETTIRTILKRQVEQKSFAISIVRVGEKPVAVGTVITHKGFVEACIGAYRYFGDFFRGLDLPDWSLTDGKETMRVREIREAILLRQACTPEGLH